MISSLPRVLIEVNTQAFKQNIRVIRSSIEPATLMVVLKSDAYGHGMLPLASAAYEEGVRAFGALTVCDALLMRKQGVPRSARIFAWLHGSDDRFDEAISAGVDLGVSTASELDRIAADVLDEPAVVHLKIDTGLHRNGADAEQWPDLVSAAAQHQTQGSLIVRGVWSHLAEASDDLDTASLRAFDSAVRVAADLGVTFETQHVAASCAGMARADARYDQVRMGAYPLGISPGGGITPQELGLTPVMRLGCHVSRLSADGDRHYAHLSAGIADGLSSSYAGKVAATIGGLRWPVTAVGIDETVIEVKRGAVREGEWCLLFGSGGSGEATLQEWADAVGTIGEEIVARLSPHIPRRYL